ncbi:MAG: DUF1838 family protein [Erythrobacter sp.]
MADKSLKSLKLRGAAIMLCSISLLAASCQDIERPLSPDELATNRAELAEILDNPASRTKLIAKVMGSTVEAERHAYLNFHVFGYAGDGNLIPFFSMNNYVIQKWRPGEDSTFEVDHYEVAYYSEFDSTEPISEWENPLTGEVVELPHFVLGPVPRLYGPGIGEDPASFAPDPLNITMIGDRVYIPTLSKFRFPNSLTTDEWGAYGGSPTTYWDSMLVYSANIEDALDEDKTHVSAEMHMQNLVSWAPYFKLGDSPGRTMVRAYGQHISGFDDLPADIRENLAKFTPEIFDLDNWTETRIDSAELAQSLAEARANGTLDIDQPDYLAPTIKRFDELDN